MNQTVSKIWLSAVAIIDNDTVTRCFTLRWRQNEDAHSECRSHSVKDAKRRLRMQLEMESLSVQTLVKLGHLSKLTIVLISGVLPSAVVFSREMKTWSCRLGLPVQIIHWNWFSSQHGHCKLSQKYDNYVITKKRKEKTHDTLKVDASLVEWDRLILKNILAQRKIEQKTTRDNEFSFFLAGEVAAILLLKYSLQIQMSLLFQYLSVLPPCCFFCLFFCLLVCFESSICFLWGWKNTSLTYQWATWDGEQISYWKLQSVWLRNDSLSQRWAATGGGWNLASAKCESGAEAKCQSRRGGGEADPITPIRTCLHNSALTGPFCFVPILHPTHKYPLPPSILLCLRV